MKILGQYQALRFLAEGLKLNRLSPSLLFVGPDGIGKKTAALELAKHYSCEARPALSAENVSLSCDRCSSCLRIGSNNYSDLLLLNRDLQAELLQEKPDAQTAVKIEAIRHLEKFVYLKPMESSRRVVILEEAHKMTNEAANALLKVLEEPPSTSQLILVATDEKSLPPTVPSRCAVVRFRPIPAAQISKWLESEHGLSAEEAAEVAEQAQGSFEKALLLNEEDETLDPLDLSQYSLGEFFDLLAETHWRKEGRKRAERAVDHLIEAAQKKLEGGDLTQVRPIRTLLSARRQLDRHVPPRLVLENLFLKCATNLNDE